MGRDPFLSMSDDPRPEAQGPRGHGAMAMAAHDKYLAATTLSAWSLLRLALGIIGPPTLVASAVTAVVEYRRARGHRR
jgi:hypothetical protein